MINEEQEVSKEQLQNKLEEAGLTVGDYERLETKIHGIKTYLAGSGVDYLLVVRDPDTGLAMGCENLWDKDPGLKEEFVSVVKDSINYTDMG